MRYGGEYYRVKGDIMNNRKFLFISHAEKDNDIVRKLVELLYDIGVPDSSIFCSSISEIGIPVKDDIYDYLQEELNSKGIIPIFVLSENYYKSVACLNEMGALWVMQKDYYVFIIPPFQFSDIKGAINQNKKGIMLDYTSENELYNLKDVLNQFKIQLQNTFALTGHKNWERKRDESINEIHDLIIDKKNIEADRNKGKDLDLGEYDSSTSWNQYVNMKNKEEIESDNNFGNRQVNISFDVYKKYSYYNILRKEEISLSWVDLFRICGQAFLDQNRSYVFKEKVANYVLNNKLLCIESENSVILSDESFAKISVSFISQGLLEMVHPNIDNDYNMMQETQYRITAKGLRYLGNLI